MPSSESPSDVSRRSLLVALGAAATLGGCAGRVGGPERVDTHPDHDADRLRWGYPSTDGDGIGYAAVGYEGPRRLDRLPDALEFVCNATVGGIAAGEGYKGYSHDWFRFRLGPPPAYSQQQGFEYTVTPPGQWETFSVYEDYRGGRREIAVELREIDTEGTIQVPVRLAPSGQPPARVQVSFTVQVSRSGPLGRTVQVSDRGTLDL